MVDIAASLSLTSNGPALDPSAIVGLETADMHAFGDILAGKVGAGDGATPAATALANPFAALTLAAGNRQPGGKILPDAGAVLPQLGVLPDAAVLEAEAPAAPVAATSPLVTAKLVATFGRTTEASAVPGAEAAPLEPAPQTEASPVHGLIKMLAAALKGQRPAAEQAEPAAAEPEAPAAGAGTEDSAIAETPAPLGVPATAIVQVQAALALPVAAATPAAPTARVPAQAQVQAQVQAPAIPGAHAAPRAAERAAAQSAVQAAVQAAADPAQAATLRAAFQIAPHPAAPQPAATQPAATQPVVIQTAAQDATSAAIEAARAPVLTVTATTAEVRVDTATLSIKPILPVAAGAVTAQIKLAPVPDRNEAVPVADRAAPSPLPSLAPVAVAGPRTAEHPVAALRSAIAEHAAPPAERAIAEFAATPIQPVADGSAQIVASAAPAQPGAAVLPGSPPAVGAEPRQDFAALVERLVEARNAGAAQSTHASIQHAEFGQVSLKFQQDGGDLSVSMTSADPDFAIAAQAAMPAERQHTNANADAQPRQQAQSQAQAGSSSHSQHEASAQRDATGSDQQGRGNRNGRNPNGNDTSNPSPRWSDRDQSQSRGGIFA